jgi:hypothetical protein
MNYLQFQISLYLSLVSTPLTTMTYPLVYHTVPPRCPLHFLVIDLIFYSPGGHDGTSPVVSHESYFSCMMRLASEEYVLITFIKKNTANPFISFKHTANQNWPSVNVTSFSLYFTRSFIRPTAYQGCASVDVTGHLCVQWISPITVSFLSICPQGHFLECSFGLRTVFRR